jgi:hypothetical protein
MDDRGGQQEAPSLAVALAGLTEGQRSL